MWGKPRNARAVGELKSTMHTTPPGLWGFTRFPQFRERSVFALKDEGEQEAEISQASTVPQAFKSEEGMQTDKGAVLCNSGTHIGDF